MADGTYTRQQAEIFCLELNPLLLDFLKLFFPLRELGIEKLDRLAGFIAVAGQILLHKNINHFLHDIAGQDGIFSVGKITGRGFRRNLEQIVLFRFDLDVLA